MAFLSKSQVKFKYGAVIANYTLLVLLSLYP